MQDDIRTMQPTVDGIVSVSAVLRSHANPLFAGRLQADVEATRTRWTAVIETSRQHTARLTTALDDTRETFDRVAALEAWLDDVTHTHLTREYTVHSDAELQQCTSNFQVCLCHHSGGYTEDLPFPPFLLFRLTFETFLRDISVYF